MKKLPLLFTLITFIVSNVITFAGEVNSSIDNAINNYMQQRELHLGLNTKDNGDTFFISVGIAPTQAPNSKSFAISRQNAFQKAFMDAKTQMSEFISSNIEAETSQKYMDGKYLENATKEEILINGKIKQLQAKNNKHSNNIREIIASEQFKSFCKTISKNKIASMWVLQSFENYTNTSKEGEVGLICVSSRKTQKLANAIASGNKDFLTGMTLVGTPQNKMFSQDNNVLLHTYGVRIRIDKNGLPVVLAFTQDKPVNESSSSIKHATDIAKQKGMALIRNFIGEIYETEKNVSQSEDIRTFDDNTQYYNSDESYSSRIKSISESKKMHGISLVKSWRAKLPFSNEIICGTVCMWQNPELKNKSTHPEKNATKNNYSDENTKENNIVESYGTGKTRNAAIKEAILEAIRMVNGGFLESKSEFNEKYHKIQSEVDSQENSESNMKRNINELTQGFVKSYKIISIEKTDDGLFEAKLKVHALRWDPDNPREGQATLLISTFEAPSGLVFKYDDKKRIPGYEAASELYALLTKAFVNSNKFIIIDRDNLNKIVQEQNYALIAVKLKRMPVQELAKIGHLLSADFMLIGNLNNINYSAKKGFDVKTGQFSNSKKILLDADFKLINVATSKIELQKRITIKINNDELDKLNEEDSILDFILNRAASQIVKDVAELKGKNK